MTARKEELESETLNELFQNWKSDVYSIDDGQQQDGFPSGASVKEKSNTDLQLEAKAYFQNTILSHERALAQMIRDLGPAFTSESLPARFRGLCILLGAIEGCRDKPMSNSSFALLGNFLSFQAGPVVDDEYEEDYDSMIRDISIKCLSALVQTQATITATAAEPSTAETNDEATTNQDFAEAFGMRVNFAQKGVERRCAAPDDMTMDGEMGIENDDLYYATNIRGGLSTMPRSKRSLCFSLLRSAVMGTSRFTKSGRDFLKKQTEQRQSAISSIVQSHCVQFAEFTAQCIHGESDPRCLLQLLELLHAIQSNFQDWFAGKITESPNNVFPNEAFFDAAAPYYPIQFTPPPNNIHGITREGLHSALISVLSFTKMDDGARRYRKPTMLGCSINLFLEQLLPGQSEEENPSTLEKLEGLECISNLIFPTAKEKNSKQIEGGMWTGSECKNLTFEEIRNLSTVLITIHDEASVGVTNGGGDLHDQNKLLAENCRSLASRIARELEKRCNEGTQGLWGRFVSEPLEKEMRKLKLTPAYAKTSIAYEASLAASGGPRTLRVCLAKGLGPLLEYLRGHLDDSSDNTLAAIHGIAAFFSSSQVTLSKSRIEGVELSPHPLEMYAKDTCNLLFKIVESEGPSHSILLKAAASSCLECLFLSSVERDLESEELIERICNFLEALVNNITVPVQDKDTIEQDGLSRYRAVSSKILGRIIGASFAGRDDDENSKTLKSRSILMAHRVQDFIQTKTFPKLMTAAFDSSEGYDGDRLDRMALATACSSSPSLASEVVRAHLEASLNALKDDVTSHASETCIEALSCILQSCVGDNVVRAFHENEVVDDIIDVLCHHLTNRAASGLRDSISQVALHATKENEDEDEETTKSKINAVNKICCGLLPAYNRLVPRNRLKKLLKTISDKIPPLSQADEGILIVRLPLLNSALQAAEPSLLEEVVSEIDKDEGLPVTQLLAGLTDYVLSDEHMSSARNAGAFCVHALLKSGFNRNLDCPAKPLLGDIYNRIHSSSNDLRVTRNCLDYLSLLSSAAALRGGSSSSTADGIAHFLTEAACKGCAQLPFCNHGEDKRIDFSVLFEEHYAQTALRIASASAFGAIMMVDGMKPLMKQRLTHGCLKYIKNLSGSKGEQNQSADLSQIGSLIVVCHVVCASDLSKFDRSIIHSLATLLMKGFSTDLFQGSSQIVTKFAAEATKARTLVVCTLLKFLCTAPKAADGFVLEIVSGLLRSYAISDPNTDIGCKLITLQALEVLAHLDEERGSILAVKPAVISILSSAMSQKNALLRSAAVDVRNVWCLVA